MAISRASLGLDASADKQKQKRVANADTQKRAETLPEGEAKAQDPVWQTLVASGSV